LTVECIVAELLFFKWHHALQSVPTPPIPNLAALPKRFDLVSAQDDGWIWGTQELTNPWFRIISWPPLQLTAALEFLLPLPADLDVDSKPITYQQYRKSFLDLSNVSVPVALRNWWQDDTRAVPIFTTNIAPAAVVAAIRTARSAVPVG
jgi:hypothetical protein